MRIKHTAINQMNQERGETVTKERETFLFDRMKAAHSRYESACRSFSGSDVAESELYRLERLFWVALYQDDGLPIESALAEFEGKWKVYAAVNNAKVENAAKIKSGPRSGQSVIGHRWVSPELAANKSIHLRVMANGMPK